MAFPVAAIVSAVAPAVLNFIKNKIKEKNPEAGEVIEAIFEDEKLRSELEKETINAILKYNEQILKELEIRERYKLKGRFAEFVRPAITISTFLIFEVSMIYGVATGKLSFSEFIQTFTPINTMLLGFWFGERSALKDPRKAEG